MSSLCECGCGREVKPGRAFFSRGCGAKKSRAVRWGHPWPPVVPAAPAPTAGNDPHDPGTLPLPLPGLNETRLFVELPPARRAPRPAPRSAPSGPASTSDAWSVPLTEAEVRESERHAMPVQLGHLNQCGACLRFRKGLAGSRVDGFVRCLHDELTCRDDAPETADALGRPPIIEDRRGDRPVYWLRADVADLGAARRCAYYLRHPCLAGFVAEAWVEGP